MAQFVISTTDRRVNPAADSGPSNWLVTMDANRPLLLNDARVNLLMRITIKYACLKLGAEISAYYWEIRVEPKGY
jgi:hypothetical protein